MNNKQKRTLKLLLLILALLVAAIVAVAVGKARQAAQEEADAQIQLEPGIVPEQQIYSALSYSNGSTTLSFAVDENGEWYWADDPEFPLDDTSVTVTLTLLSTLKPQQTITEGDTLEAYGLDEPFATLTATLTADEGGAPGETLTLSFGNATTDGTSYYMLMNGEPSPVYIVADTLYQQMSKPIFDMCRLPELPALPEQSITLITLKGRERTTVLRPETDGEGEDAAVIWKHSGEDITTRADTAALLAELSALSITKCVDFKPSADAVTICGFGAPSATLTVLYRTEGGADEQLVLTLGNQTLDGAGHYVRLEGDDTIYQMAQESVDTLLRVAETGL